MEYNKYINFDDRDKSLHQIVSTDQQKWKKKNL